MSQAVFNGEVTFGPTVFPIRIVTGEHDSTPKYTYVQECCDTKTPASCGCGRNVKTKRYTAPNGNVYSPPALSKAKADRQVIAEGVYDSIDPALLGKMFTVVPRQGGEHAYAVLNAALNRTGKTIVVAITMKTKRKHYALRGDMVAMVAQEINYADDMLDLDPSDDWDRVKPDPKAVDGTVKLLESMTVRGLYEPIHNPQLVEMERNIEGMAPDSTPADTPETAPVDLLAGVR